MGRKRLLDRTCLPLPVILGLDPRIRPFGAPSKIDGRARGAVTTAQIASGL
jgi:hypothetical protein